MKAIILAAGYATRLWPLTKDRPKPLLEVFGKPMINHLIEKISEIGEVDEIFIITNNKFYNNFKLWQRQHQSRFNRKIEIINDNTESNDTRLGGMGDLHLIMKNKKIDDDIIIALGDNFFDFSIKDFANSFIKNKKIMIGGYRINKDKAKCFGVIEFSENGAIKSIEEKPENPKSNVVVIGLYAFPKNKLNLIEEYMKTDKDKDGVTYLIKDLIDKEEVIAHSFEGKWRDIGTVEEYERINNKFYDQPID